VISSRLSRLAREDGYSLVELLTVMALLGTVLTVIVGSFTTAMRHQAIAMNQAEVFSNARLALQRMRLDIHCAHSQVSQLPVQQNPYGGFTLTLTETAGQCSGVLAGGAGVSGVEWCTIPYTPGDTTRYELFRYDSSALSSCDGGPGSTFEVDYVAAPPSGWPTNSGTSPAPTSWAGNIWPTSSSCVPGGLPAIAVDLNIALNAASYPTQHYELADQIAELNANPC
jgi:prepilin-type N-terminal cleavage/methylation domain-containing protein